MAVDAGIIGRETGRARVKVERSPLRIFASAVKDENPVYHDADAAKSAGFDDAPAPPTFGFALEFWGRYPELQQGLEPIEGNPFGEVMSELMKDGGLILHGEQEFEYHRPIVAGDVLRSEAKIVDAYEKESKGRTMTFVVTETLYRDDESGEPVLTSRFNLIHRA
jgi:acyl dehydratase